MLTARLLCFFASAALLAGCGGSRTPEAGSSSAKEKARPAASVQAAIEVVSQPQGPFGNMGGIGPQTAARLVNLHNYSRGFSYDFKPADRPAWKHLMQDEKAGIYARLCAAYFLLDDDQEAQALLRRTLASDNLRHRYNAAGVLSRYFEGDPKKTWCIELSIELLNNKSLDGSGVTSSPPAGPGEFPEGDRDDIMDTPIDLICDKLGSAKEPKAIDALIGVLERRPKTTGAAWGLAEIGDKRAVPVLVKILKEGTGDDQSLVEALVKLKCRDAVPEILACLQNPERRRGLRTDIWVGAFLEFRDPRAIPILEKMVKEGKDSEEARTARRVLVRLRDADPVAGLIDLLRSEKDESMCCHIMYDLAKYRDPRAADEFARIARTSDSGDIRASAIQALGWQGTQQALLRLAALLRVDFPKSLGKHHDKIETPEEYSAYLPALILDGLKRETKQDFGRNADKWERWIRENVKGEDVDHVQPSKP